MRGLRLFQKTLLKSITSTQVSGPLEGRQISKISPDQSDHVHIAVNVAGSQEKHSRVFGKREPLVVLVGNELKKCHPKNNGFGKTETEEEYLERYMNQLIKRCDYLLANSFKIQGNTAQGVFATFNQESVIQKNHIQQKIETMNACGVSGKHYTKPSGLSTFFVEQVADAFIEVGVPSENLQLFRSSESYCVANIHTPYTARKSLQQAVHASEISETERYASMKSEYKKLVRMILLQDNIPEADGVPVKVVDLAGDKNIPPHIQLEVVQEVCAEIAAERKAAGKSVFNVASYKVTNPNGHQQNENGKVVLVDVDSYHRLVLVPSLDYSFSHFHTKKSPKKKNKL